MTWAEATYRIVLTICITIVLVRFLDLSFSVKPAEDDDDVGA